MSDDNQNQLKNKSLIEIAEQSLHLEIMLIASEGEITEEISSHIASINLELPSKLESYARIIERMKSLSADYDREIKRLEKIKDGIEKTETFLKSNIRHVMNRLNVKELNGHTCRYILKKIAPKLVLDESALPSEMKVIVQTFKPDREKILLAIDEGKLVAGAHLEDNFALTKVAKK